MKTGRRHWLRSTTFGRAIQSDAPALVMATQRYLDGGLAVHLMVQPSVARIFMADPLAVDTGFLPRFLICEPQSTIGSRLQAKTRHDDMELEEFSSRMRRILEMKMPMDAETRELEPRVLELAADARDICGYIL